MQIKLSTFRHITQCLEKEWKHNEINDKESKNYQPPEMIQGSAYNDRDYAPWCFGVILFALLTGKLPFQSLDPYYLKELIINRDYKWPKNIQIS